MRLLLIIISIMLPLTLLASMFFLRSITPWISISVLAVSISMAISLSVEKHWRTYQRAECTREKMIRNLTVDLLGFVLSIGTAMYAGRIAGGFVGQRVGFWIGLLAGFAGGFLAAWAVRSAWGKFVFARI